MNERIRELAHAAGLPTYNPAGIPTKLERFAELIIRECANQVSRKSEATSILEHFGIDNETTQDDAPTP